MLPILQCSGFNGQHIGIVPSRHIGDDAALQTGDGTMLARMPCLR